MRCRVRVCHQLLTIGIKNIDENVMAMCRGHFVDGFVRIKHSRTMWWLSLLVSNAEFFRKRDTRKIFISRGLVE